MAKTVTKKAVNHNPSLERLNGLEWYYKSKNRKELNSFFTDTMERLREDEELNPNILTMVEQLEQEYIDTKDNKLQDAINICGKLVSILNHHSSN